MAKPARPDERMPAAARERPPSDRVPDAPPEVPLSEIALAWTRIGITGFGGPPTHIVLLRRLCVERKHWITLTEFQDAVSATNLLPGPASTQLAIYCAWRLRGRLGALIGGCGFIIPGLILILALAVLFLSGSPPRWALGAGAGAGAAVPAVAVSAALALLPASWPRTVRSQRPRWIAYLLLGVLATVFTGSWLVLTVLGCGALEVAWRILRPRAAGLGLHTWPLFLLTASSLAAVSGGVGALIWVAFKVGALSFGGGFVIIPLMQNEAVSVHHWMTSAQFLNAVALGQITPGPVVQTVAVVGYAAGGILAGLLAALVAFSPSFAFIVLGGSHFDRLRHSAPAQAFLAGAGPAVIGAIFGSAVLLGHGLHHGWQFGVLAAAAVALILLRRGVVEVLLGAGVLGTALALAGVSVSA